MAGDDRAERRRWNEADPRRQQIERGVLDDGHVLRPVAGSQPCQVVAEDDIQHPVQPVLDAPAASDTAGEGVSTQFGRAKVIARLPLDLVPPSTQVKKHCLNSAGSSATMTSVSESWLGMPCRNDRKRRRKGRCSVPHSAISVKSSAPAMVAHSTTSRISGKGYRTFAACRGSRSAAKCVRKSTCVGCSMWASSLEVPYESYFPPRRNPPFARLPCLPLVEGLAVTRFGCYS